MLHLIRKGISEGCPVCAAGAFDPCIPGDMPARVHSPEMYPMAPVQLEMDLQPIPGEVALLEYQVIHAVRRLRELRPKHVLVTVVAAVLKYQSGEQSLR